MGRKPKKGICVYVQLIHFAVQQKLTQHCKATILQKKLIEKNKTKNEPHTSLFGRADEQPT